MKHSLIGIDLAKNTFQICALNQHNKVIFNKKVSRSKLLHELRQLEPTTIVMESCYSANHWGRAAQTMGHEVKLIPPHQVKPFLIGNKNDSNDALAIAEAASRPKARFVPVKTLQHQDIQSLQRIRERCLRHRTAVYNQVRGLLSEYGVTVERSVAKIASAMPWILEDAENGLTMTARQFLSDLHQEASQLSDRIKAIEAQRDELLKDNDQYRRLQTIRGVGPVGAAELIAAVGDARQFKNGRQMAAWIGLTPKQYASGDTTIMGGISKRGHRTLRKLLIHGARTVMNWAHKRDDKLSTWIVELKKRMHPCKAIVAIANKIARICWAVMAHEVDYVNA